MVCFLFENQLDIFLLVFYEYFVYDKGTYCSSNWRSFDQKKTWKSPWQSSFKLCNFMQLHYSELCLSLTPLGLASAVLLREVSAL